MTWWKKKPPREHVLLAEAYDAAKAFYHAHNMDFDPNHVPFVLSTVVEISGSNKDSETKRTSVLLLVLAAMEEPHWDLLSRRTKMIQRKE